MESQRRNTLLINRRFQLSLIVKFLLLNIAVLALFSLFIYLFLDSEIDTNLKSAHAKYSNMKEMLLPIVLSLSSINILVSSIIITLFVLIMSFRIAGPLYRFNAVISDMKAGNLKPFTKIRKKDQLYQISINLENLSEKLREDFRLINQSMVQIKTSQSDPGNEQLNDQIMCIEKVIRKYQF